MLPELTVPGDAASTPSTPRPGGDGLAAGLVVLPADETNGLEFDSVIVVEPSLIAAVGDEPAGEGRRWPPLGVAHPLRRTHQTHEAAGVVHVDPLPSNCSDLGFWCETGPRRRDP